MNKDWRELTKLTDGQKLIVERIRMESSGISIEGSFELPELAALSAEDQVFVAAFVKSHGSIKQMEKYFGVSYPTVKNRLNRIGEMLTFVQIESDPDEPVLIDKIPDLNRETKESILEDLEDGEIDFDEAMRRLNDKR
ncbi:MAG TPA: DUF2089 domain-containing protein [candidate division Zixibacteria bacterium]|nr:DUF2089 domain-containing protein [candidate division Zixibacteria bacterium]